MLDLLKDTQNSPSPLVQCFTKSGKVCQSVVARNEQANLQRRLNKRAGGASLTIFVTIAAIKINKILSKCNRLKGFSIY